MKVFGSCSGYFGEVIGPVGVTNFGAVRIGADEMCDREAHGSPSGKVEY